MRGRAGDERGGRDVNQYALLTNQGQEGATCSRVLGGWVLGMGDATAAGWDNAVRVCGGGCIC